MKTTDFKKQVAHVLCSFKIYIYACDLNRQITAKSGTWL